MLVTWEAATESTSAMESYLRRAAKEGAVQKVASLLERSVVNLLSVDKVCARVGGMCGPGLADLANGQGGVALPHQSGTLHHYTQPVSTPPTYSQHSDTCVQDGHTALDLATMPPPFSLPVRCQDSATVAIS